MYTSLGKANDRFGFETKGSFKCAYKSDSLITVIGAAIILLWVILIIINFASIGIYLSTPGITMYDTDRIEELDRQAYSQSRGMSDDAERIGNGDEKLSVFGSSEVHMMDGFSSGFMGMSTNFIALAFGLLVLILLLIAFFVVMMLVRKGRTFLFKANDNSFTITYPKKKNDTEEKVIELVYDDVLGLKWQSRKFPLLPECYDMTVKTRTYGDLEFRVILTKLARANGIIETPFNIIREKIGIAAKDERYLINRGISSKK